MSNLESFLQIPFFKDCINKLSVTSKDGDGIMLIDDIEDEIINFDLVKRKFCNSYGKTEEVFKSVDGLFYDKEKDKLVFVEFKNGENIKNKEIKGKLKDSLLIFTDISNVKMDFCRKNCKYIVVYNSDKHDLEESDGYRLVTVPVFKLAKIELKHFGVELLEGICVEEAHTYCEDSFRDYYKNACQVN